MVLASGAMVQAEPSDLWGRDGERWQNGSRLPDFSCAGFAQGEMVNNNIQNGEFAMFIAYGGRDQFNLDAQVESFLYVAHQRGIDITVAYDPRGKHDARTARSFFPALQEFLLPHMEPFR